MQYAFASSRLSLPFHTRINAVRSQHRTPARALFSGSRKDGGAAVIDRPGFLTGDQNDNTKTESGWGASQGDNKRTTGGGHHRVIILDSERHTEETVVKAITTAIPGTSKDHAANCFHTARSLGMALVTTALLEIAEFYAQQLYALGVRATIEPDTTTL